MLRNELEQWLCGPDSTPPSPAAIAAALGLSVTAFADTTLLRTAARIRSLRFTLAVLHDAFASDTDVCRWLETPREELNGMSPRAALIAGRGSLVEELAVQTWNEDVRMAGAA
jgi:Rv2175c C-terminal domain of unknown function